jgi:beta-glucosidase
MKINYTFPEKFYWGAASASYQVEGGIYNVDWTVGAEQVKVPPADDRVDHYNKYERDFEIARELGQNCQRISIEWARIEPEEGKFNQEEIEHYRKVIQTIKEKGMEPFVTLWHFTLPIWFYEKGGFTNKKAPEIFARYCNFVLEHLHGEAKFWDTINEPNVWASNGHLRGNWPPFKKCPRLYFKVLKNLSKAHNLVYKTNKELYPEIEIGIVKDNINFRSDWKPWNKIACKITDYFWNHYFLKKIQNNVDHIGLNYYFDSFIGSKPKWYKDLPKSDMGWTLSPKGIYYVLRDLARYKKPVYITEAGIADSEDKYRAEYIRGLIQWTHQAIQDGVDVRGFMYWSLLDNFEWALGYDKEFGLVHVTPEGEREIRKSAYNYKEICESNALRIE